MKHLLFHGKPRKIRFIFAPILCTELCKIPWTVCKKKRVCWTLKSLDWGKIIKLQRKILNWKWKEKTWNFWHNFTLITAQQQSKLCNLWSQAWSSNSRFLKGSISSNLIRFFVTFFAHKIDSFFMLQRSFNLTISSRKKGQKGVKIGQIHCLKLSMNLNMYSNFFPVRIFIGDKSRIQVFEGRKK